MQAHFNAYSHVVFKNTLSIAEAYSLAKKYDGYILWVNRSFTYDSIHYSISSYNYTNESRIKENATSNHIEDLWVKRRKYSPERKRLEAEYSISQMGLKAVQERLRQSEKKFEEQIQAESYRKKSRGDRKAIARSYRKRIEARQGQLRSIEKRSEDILVKIDILDSMADSTYGKSIRLDQMLVKHRVYRRIERDSRVLSVKKYSKEESEKRFFPEWIPITH